MTTYQVWMMYAPVFSEADKLRDKWCALRRHNPNDFTPKIKRLFEQAEIPMDSVAIRPGEFYGLVYVRASSNLAGPLLSQWQTEGHVRSFTLKFDTYEPHFGHM
jgi:hypothetical protein